MIRQLTAANVESYHVDYRSARSTYYLGNGNTLDLDFEPTEDGIGNLFDGDAVRAAITGAQRGDVMYPAFKTLTQHAGCSMAAISILVIPFMASNAR